MRSPLLCAALAAAVASPLAAQVNKTLFFAPRYDTPALDSTAGPILGALRPFDVCAVTPGKGATAFPAVPGAAISAMVGDGDNDGVVAEFAGLPHASFGIGGIFIKHSDRKSADPSKLYFGIRETSASNPKIVLPTATGTHTVQLGDFFRMKADGNAELFITRQLIMTAAGTQTGNYVEGAGSLCQDASGNLNYSPPNGVSFAGTVAGGHWVGGTWCNDGAIIQIPSTAITYDANGNVSKITAGSARIVAKEVGGTLPTRTMCGNSGAVDRNGVKTTVTWTMTGMEIDPNGGTFTPQFSSTAKVPNLIFCFNTGTAGAYHGWRGTIFTTADNGATRGDLAKFNGQAMGVKTGTADGSWNGLGLNTSFVDAPAIRGLAWMDTGWKSAAPHGHTAIQVPNDGLVDIKKDANIRIALQGAEAFLPVTLALGLGVKKGGRALNFDLNVWRGFGPLYILNPLAILPGGAIDAKGRGNVVVPVPTNDPSLIGVNAQWQALSVAGAGAPILSNVVAIEIR